jgi:capsular exopolysaccharide synthesis family protein
MELNDIESTPKSAFMPLNPMRVLDRIIRFWYILAASLLIALSGAYLVNRYSDKIYPISASILIRESEENIGAKFLYNNSLLNPYRNYYNEFFIMRSYPLLQEVVEELGFHIEWYKAGDIKTVEQYLPQFPVRIVAAPGSKFPYGKSFRFVVRSEREFSLQELESTEIATFTFNSKIDLKGDQLLFTKSESAEKWIGVEFILRFVDPYIIAKQYANKLKLTWAADGSAVVNLQVSGPVREKEVDFLKKFIEHYQEYDISKKQLIASISINFLDTQVDNISDSLLFYEDKITYNELTQDYSRERSLEKITSMGESMEQQEIQLRLKNLYFTYLESYLKNEKDFDQVILPTALGIDDPIMADLIASLLKIQFEARLLKGHLENTANPLIQETKDRIGQYKRDINEAIRSARDIMKLNRGMYDERIHELEKSLKQVSEPDKVISNMRRNYKLMETLYSFLIQKRAEAALSRASTTSDIIIINPPEAGPATTPKDFQNYMIALIGGLLFPILGFMLAELLNSRIQSKDDIEHLTTVPVIGGLGHNPEENPLIVINKPRSAMAEAFRAIRSNLSYFTENKDHQVFLITSSIAGEGKSFTTLNMASVLAMAGKKTLLIGADLRRPKLFEELSLSNAKGLSQYLSKLSNIDDIIQPSMQENLFLLTAGPVPPNPSELLMRKEMAELILKLREEYDYVLIDTPPVGIVTDAFVLAPLADHVLFVVRQNYTPRVVLRALEEYHHNGKFEKASIVFNDLRKSGFGYGYGYKSYSYYGYDRGYSYYYGRKKKKNGDGYYLD